MKTKYFFYCFLIVLSSCTAGNSPIMEINYSDLQPIQQLVSSDSTARIFIISFKRDVEAHNWVYVLSYFDKENYKVQQKIGVGDIQYIAEGMGLNYEDNYLEQRENDASKYSKLNNIIFLDYKGYRTNGKMIYIYGYAKMYTGSDKRFEIPCYKEGNKIVIMPPVG